MDIERYMYIIIRGSVRGTLVTICITFLMRKKMLSMRGKSVFLLVFGKKMPNNMVYRFTKKISSLSYLLSI